MRTLETVTELLRQATGYQGLIGPGTRLRAVLKTPSQSIQFAALLVYKMPEASLDLTSNPTVGDLVAQIDRKQTVHTQTTLTTDWLGMDRLPERAEHIPGLGWMVSALLIGGLILMGYLLIGAPELDQNSRCTLSSDCAQAETTSTQ